MIQNRITTVTCSQPSSSKWCCRGAIRNTRWPGPTRNSVRMAYVRGPEGIIVCLFEQIG